MEPAKRILNLGSAAFNEIEQAIQEVQQNNQQSIINLGIGSPDLPPAPHIISAMHNALDKRQNYRYQLVGKARLHQALAHWYQKRFGVKLDPASQVQVLMGSQDGLAHIAWAYINPGDIVLVPDPGYPIYSAGTLLAGGRIYPVPLLAQNNFLPDLTAIPTDIAQKAKMMWVNYPNNPVAASADLEFFQSLVEFAQKYQILICHDLAYCELAFDGFKPPSFLEVPGAVDVGIEFYSLSKTYNMAGCRVGFAVGNKDIIATLAKVKGNIDYGVFGVVQEGGIAALEGPQDFVQNNAAVYCQRRDVLLDSLDKLGWRIPKPKASMFVWAPLPLNYTSSQDFAMQLLYNTGVVVVPGVAFGEQGEGYVRMALVEDETVLLDAANRIGAFLNR